MYLLYHNRCSLILNYCCVQVNDMDCTLKLPVVRADKRYFSLNYRGDNKDQWGIISDVTVQGAETIVTLRSMLQVFTCIY